MFSLYPKYKFDRITQITTEDLKQMGVKGIAVDLDNTTAHDFTDIPLDGVVEWIEKIKQSGFKILLLTNADIERAKRFSKLLGGIEYIGFACKPLSKAYIRAKETLGLELHQIAMIGDQLFTDVWGANYAGMISIYVNPFAPEKRSVKSFKVRRKIEKWIFNTKKSWSNNTQK